MHNAKRQEQRIEKNQEFRTARMRMKKMNFHARRLLNFDLRKSNDCSHGFNYWRGEFREYLSDIIRLSGSLFVSLFAGSCFHQKIVRHAYDFSHGDIPVGSLREPPLAHSLRSH